jgi:hypothetical protein
MVRAGASRGAAAAGACGLSLPLRFCPELSRISRSMRPPRPRKTPAHRPAPRLAAATFCLAIAAVSAICPSCRAGCTYISANFLLDVFVQEVTFFQRDPFASVAAAVGNTERCRFVCAEARSWFAVGRPFLRTSLEAGYIQQMLNSLHLQALQVLRAYYSNTKPPSTRASSKKAS